MGYVTRFYIRPSKIPLIRAYDGSFVMDEDGHVTASTLSSALPGNRIQEIAKVVFDILRASASKEVHLTEFEVSYDRLELRVTRSRSRTHVILKAKAVLGL